MPVRTLALALAAALALAVGAPAAAQPRCAACARGDELVERFSLEPLRSIAGGLADLQLDEPLAPEQYARIVELRRRSPALARLGAVDDAGLAAIAAALCRAPTSACTDATTRALRCLADRCEVAIPPADAAQLPADCWRRDARDGRTAPLGVGLAWGTGWHRSRYPNDGHATSLGIEARLRVGRRFGAVARIDRVEGRDAATDGDGDGEDDVATGSIIRIATLAGPSLVIDHTRFERTTRLFRLDLLGGYVSTRSQADESGPAVGLDLGYQVWIARVGVRFVRGFGEARDTTMLLAHLGFVAGAAPPRRGHAGCSTATAARSSRLALGFDFPLVGYGLSSELGVLTPGLGLELAWRLTSKLDALAHADLLYFPRPERERAVHQAALAGVRFDHGASGRRRAKTGFFTTIMGGYSHGAGITPTTTGPGPIGDLSFGLGLKAAEAAAYLRVHGRFGIGPDNVDYRAVFLSAGFEVHFDPRQWR